jgi:hypothetical protein
MKSIIKRANKFIEKNNTLTKGNIWAIKIYYQKKL